MRFRALLAVLVLGLASAGCGSDDKSAPEPVERKDETAQKLPKLERGYEEFVNRAAGVAFGRPPGWAAKEMDALTTLAAPDKLVAATITIDRTSDALAGSPKAFATETARLLPGYEKALDPGKAKPFGHMYDGAIVEAEGVAKRSGVRQHVQVVVLERKGVAVVTGVVAANAKEDAGAEEKQALESLRTLRTRPPG